MNTRPDEILSLKLGALPQPDLVMGTPLEAELWQDLEGCGSPRECIDKVVLCTPPLPRLKWG